MAGDWIKMRGGLVQHPRAIGMGRHLMRSKEFREWLTPGGGGPMNGQLVSDDALRCVTCALLLRVWSAAREYGKLEGDDLVLAHIGIPDLDLMASCPGVGKAMQLVGWAQVKDGENGGVVLPNFRQHNAPMTPAEKQSAYRSRHGARAEPGNNSVTEPLPKKVTKRSPEKRREEKEDSSGPAEPVEADSEPKKKTPAKAPTGPHADAVRGFCDAWERRWGSDYPFNGGKDGQAVKWMLTKVDGDVERFISVVGRYLADGSEFVVSNRHTVGLLRSQFAKWLPEPNAIPPPESGEQLRDRERRRRESIENPAADLPNSLLDNLTKRRREREAGHGTADRQGRPDSGG